MQHHREAALHVGHTGAVQGLLVQPALVLERMVGGEHGIHVSRQQDTAIRLRAYPHQQMLPVRLVEGGAVGGNRGNGGGIDQFNRAGKRRECLRQCGSLLGQSGKIGRAGVDRAPRLHLREHGGGIEGGKIGLRSHGLPPLAARTRLSNPLQSCLHCAIGALSSPPRA